jgi:hypothetical protein
MGANTDWKQELQLRATGEGAAAPGTCPMSTRLPLGRNVVGIQRFEYLGSAGEYRGTVNAAGWPHGRGDWDITEGKWVGWAYSCEWVDGKATGVGWVQWPSGAVYAGALLDGDPHGRGVFQLAGAEGGRLEGAFEGGRPVEECVLLLAGDVPREYWRVRMEGRVELCDMSSLWYGMHPSVRWLEPLGRVAEGGPPAPRREGGGRLPGPEWAAKVERPDGAVVRVRCRSPAQVRAPLSLPLSLSPCSCRE